VLRRPTAVRSHCRFDRQATDCTTGRKGHRTTAQCSRRRRRRSRGDEAVATTGITSGRMPPTWARRVPSIRLLCTTTTTHHRLTTLQQPNSITQSHVDGHERTRSPSPIFQPRKPMGSPFQCALQNHKQVSPPHKTADEHAPENAERNRPMTEHTDTVRTKRQLAHATTAPLVAQMPHHRPPPTVLCLPQCGRPTAPPRPAPTTTPTRHAITNDIATMKALHGCSPTHTRRWPIDDTVAAERTARGRFCKERE
jgi:hypothetical protein